MLIELQYIEVTAEWSIRYALVCAGDWDCCVQEGTNMCRVNMSKSIDIRVQWYVDSLTSNSGHD